MRAHRVAYAYVCRREFAAHSSQFRLESFTIDLADRRRVASFSHTNFCRRKTKRINYLHPSASANKITGYRPELSATDLLTYCENDDDEKKTDVICWIGSQICVECVGECTLQWLIWEEGPGRQVRRYSTWSPVVLILLWTIFYRKQLSSLSKKYWLFLIHIIIWWW